MTLAEQVALVTGAGTGIDRAVVQALVEQGARVVLAGRRMEKLQKTVVSFGDEAQVSCHATDVSDRASVRSLVREIAENMGAISLLVNNAGINTPVRSLGRVDPLDWDRTLAINTTGAFNCVRAVLPSMREQGYGLIVNVSSIAGIQASRQAGAAYSASKHAMMALNHSINEEESHHGIRATAICPGEVNTEMLKFRPPENRVTDREKDREKILQPEDVAAAVLFVASLPARACVTELVIEPVACL